MVAHLVRVRVRARVRVRVKARVRARVICGGLDPEQRRGRTRTPIVAVGAA